MDVLGSTSMFRQTLARIDGDAFAPPLVVCNDEHRFLVAEELRRLEITPSGILLEPLARNTAPAIAVAALHLLAKDTDAVMLVLPSDHVVGDTDAFVHAAQTAAGHAADGQLVTFGVTPTRPEPGYGYIRSGAAMASGAWEVAQFVEKPDTETAKKFLTAGGYFWNAGMFMFGAGAYLEELARHQPDIIPAAREALSAGHADLDFFRIDRTAFERAPAVSVDYAVMEKTGRAVMVPLSTSWSDVGSWASLWELGNHDDRGNVAEGRTLVLDSDDNYIRSEKPLIAALGVRGLAIVATDDTVLVLPVDRAQEVRDIVAELDASGHEETVTHTRVYRPWGHYQNLEGGDGFLVKRIVVNAGAKLSLQYHHKRAEHWIVVAGTARVTNDGETFDLGPNQSTYIPLGAPHRLENPGAEPLHLIEVQSGDYIGEDDIVRLEDTYGRQSRPAGNS